MRVEKREFASEFSQLSCPGQTRTRVAWELMRVEKREFTWEFSQLSCSGQTRTRVAWELRSESLHESWVDITGQTSKNSHPNFKQLTRVDSEPVLDSHQTLIFVWANSQATWSLSKNLALFINRHNIAVGKYIHFPQVRAKRTWLINYKLTRIIFLFTNSSYFVPLHEG
jgi:hypothetical protein